MNANLVKLVFFAPTTHADIVRKAMGDAGAGKMGNYSHSSWSSIGHGRCIPLEGANSAYGEIGKLQVVEEERIETLCEKEKVKEVVEAIKKVHPYEEVDFDIIQLVGLDDL
jgi:hypothetical protein